MQAGLENIKTQPALAMELVDSFQDLLTLCQGAAAQVAEQIEAEMKEELVKAKTKLQMERPLGFNAGDLPAAHLQEAAEELGGGSVGSSDAMAPQQATVPAYALASALMSSPRWENWKHRMRGALIDSQHSNSGSDSDAQLSQGPLSLQLNCNGRTSGDKPLSTRLTLSAQGDDLVWVRQRGADGGGAARALHLLMFAQIPERFMLERLASECWKAAQLNEPSRFECELFLRHENFQCDDDTYSTSATTPDGPQQEATISLGGDGRSLKAAYMSVTGLECEEFAGSSERGWSPWVPADGTVRFRRRLRLERRRQTEHTWPKAYEVRTVGDGGDRNEVVQQVDRGQVLAMMECLDAFAMLCPRWCPLGEPRLDVRPLSPLRRAESTLHAMVTAPARMLLRRPSPAGN
jgi:hypothetical protein